MNDEGFHLTPVDVRRFEFGSALRGYDKARVDQFREQVADELERMARLTQELEAKARGFHEQLKAFRDRDKALNEALISAQQMRAETRDQAEREGKIILREAELQAERILDAGRAEVLKLERNVDALERLRRTYIIQMKKMAEQHLAELTVAERLPMPGRPAPLKDPGPSESAPAPASAPAPTPPAEPAE